MLYTYFFYNYMVIGIADILGSEVKDCGDMKNFIKAYVRI